MTGSRLHASIAGGGADDGEGVSLELSKPLLVGKGEGLECVKCRKPKITKAGGRKATRMSEEGGKAEKKTRVLLDKLISTLPAPPVATILPSLRLPCSWKRMSHRAWIRSRGRVAFERRPTHRR